MKRIVTMAALLAAVGAGAEPSGDRPDDTHAWAVHDVNRPDPEKVAVSAAGVPADAIVLFDGTAESIARHWCAEDGAASQWQVKDGTFVCTPGSGSAFTKEAFADCQLHIEWQTPVDDVEGWGNSGVILMDEYEIQILDSSAIEASNSPWKSANYADGQAGAVYGQNPPLVNTCRKPGEWQSFDIVFHPPYREDGRLVDTGTVSVFQNGVLVQDNWQLQGSTTWCRRASTHPAAGSGRLSLQDHGHPVPFRNVWIRRIPARQANCVNGGPYAKRGEVAKKRHELAAASRALAAAAVDPLERYVRLWEAYCYEPDREVKALIKPAEEACVAELKKGAQVEAYHVSSLKRFVKMLVDSGWMAEGGEVEKALEAWKGPAKPSGGNMRDF